MTHTQTSDQGATVPTTEERSGNALTVAEQTFRLLITGPCPLAIDGQEVGHGLPARPIDLGELKDLLLDRGSSDALKDAAWAELVRRARTDGPAWVVGCVGVAMPGLKNVAGRVIRTSPAQLAEDIVSELLAEFVAQLRRVDTSRPHIAARLLLWARKGALRARGREMRHVSCELDEVLACPSGPDGDPMDLVVNAVRQEIIAPETAALIISTRLDGMSLQDFARRQGVPADRLYKQRRVAEARLVAAVRDCRVSAVSAGLLTEPSPCMSVPPRSGSGGRTAVSPWTERGLSRALGS